MRKQYEVMASYYYSNIKIEEFNSISLALNFASNCLLDPACVHVQIWDNDEETKIFDFER